MAGKNKIILPLWLLFTLLAVIILRVPSLFYPYSYGDQGIYLTLGQAIRQGLILYRDIYDNKPPLLYLLAAVASSLFWFQTILLFWNIATILFFRKLAQKIFEDQEKPIILSTVALAFLTNWPSFEGNVANAEIFMILPIIVGFWLLYQIMDRKNNKVLVFTGILFSLAGLFKVPAFFDFGAAFVFAFVYLKDKINKLFFLLIGFSLPILIFILYFALNNSLEAFINTAFAQNISYLSSWKGKTQGMAVGNGFLIRSLLLGISTLLLFIFNKKLDKKTLLISLWLVFGLFGVTLSERPYPHYLLQIMPAVSLGLGFLCIKVKVVNKIIIILLFCLTLGAHQYLKFWNYPSIPYYQNFLSWVTKQKSTQNYLSYYNTKMVNNQKIALFLNSNTNSSERIFVWGDDAPNIYAQSRRLPAGIYAANYHIKDYQAFEETITAIEKTKPKFIVILDNKDRFDHLEEIITLKYQSLSTQNGASIYFRKTF